MKGRHAKDWKWFIGTAVPYTRNKDGSVKEVACTFLSLEQGSDTPRQTEQAIRTLKQSIHLLELQLLSKREQEVIFLLLEGNGEKMIAAKLGIAVRTVEFHLAEIRRKWQVPNIAALVGKAKDMGL
jgi:DNA-binding NarL/FixJ family response regulator